MENHLYLYPFLDISYSDEHFSFTQLDIFELANKPTTNCSLIYDLLKLKTQNTISSASIFYITTKQYTVLWFEFGAGTSALESVRIRRAVQMNIVLNTHMSVELNVADAVTLTSL